MLRDRDKCEGPTPTFNKLLKVQILGAFLGKRKTHMGQLNYMQKSQE